MDTRPPFRLSPSSLTYLVEECSACFYRHAHGERRPSTPFPSVFSKLDRDQKEAWLGRPTTDLDPSLPAGAITEGTWVTSAPIPVGGIEVVFRGVTDSHLALCDGTVGVIDFKTVIPKDDQVALYSRQLHAYAWAMEQPSKAWVEPLRVTQLGLVAFPPEGMRRLDDGTWVYLTHPEWIPIPRNDNGFRTFLECLGGLLTSSPPPPNPDCQFCQWRNAA